MGCPRRIWSVASSFRAGPSPWFLVHVLCEVIGTGLLVLPESIGRRASDQPRRSEVLRDGQRILDIAVGRTKSFWRYAASARR